MKMNDDAELERALRHALRRIEPERDFSALVYSRGSATSWTRSRTMLALAAVIILMLLVPAGVVRYQARQRRGEEAREKLITAFRITGSKLQKTRQMVVRELNRRNSL